MTTRDILIRDFTHPLFQSAFKRYFAEMDVHVSQWDRLFSELNAGQRNLAYLRLAADDSPVGFVLFAPLALTSWFLEIQAGFVREFWVAPELRRQGHGSALLRLAEESFSAQGFAYSFLTTDSAEAFYLRRGYVRADGVTAKNHDDVFVKALRPTASGK